jgi:hypothetical protein
MYDAAPTEHTRLDALPTATAESLRRVGARHDLAVENSLRLLRIA